MIAGKFKIIQMSNGNTIIEWKDSNGKKQSRMIPSLEKELDKYLTLHGFR